MNIKDQKKLEEKRHEDLKGLYHSKHFNELVSSSKNFIKQYPSNPGGFNLLGLALFNLEKYNEAIELYENLLVDNPNIISFLNNLGDIYRAQGKHKKAKEVYKRALKINPNSFSSCNGLGLIYFSNDKMVDAKLYFEKALEIKPKESSVCYYLGEINRLMLEYDKAIEYYKLSDVRLSKAHIIECFYLSKNRDIFDREQKNIIYQEEINPLLASIQTHASIRYDLPDNNLFCQSPFEYIYHSKLTAEEGFDTDLIDKLYNHIRNFDYLPQPLLNNGDQSAGNIFSSNEPYIQKMKDIILSRIDDYRENFKDSDNGFIKKWPSNFNIQGWIIDIKKGGNLKSHMHKLGWLSGSLYLNIPKKEDPSEGNIVFSLHGADYPKNEKTFPSKEIDINKNDIVLFPSSIFHHTLPFNSEENRVTLAFDIKPKY